MKRNKKRNRKNYRKYSGNSINKNESKNNSKSNSKTNGAPKQIPTKDFAANFKTNFIIALMPCFLYLILGPLEIYKANVQEFEFEIRDFWGSFIVISVILAAVAAALLALLSTKIQDICRKAIFASGVLSYIQYILLNRKMSENDGTPMNWGAIQGTIHINTFIWVCLIVLIVVLSKVLKKVWQDIMVYGSLILTAIQLVAVVSLMIPNGDQNSIGELGMDGSEQFAVGSENNIIVIVLDTFGTLQMNEAYELYPDLLEGLEDFTYYDNADCHYYCTFPSMTHLLTGNNFDFTSESREWLDTSWHTDRAVSFYEELHRSNYVCNLFSADVKSVYGSFENLYGKFDNIHELETIADTSQILGLMSKMSAYRYVPYILKPRFEVLTVEFSEAVTVKEGVDPIGDNSKFYKKLTSDRLKVRKDTKNMLIVEHLAGTHTPYTIDENAQYIGQGEVHSTVAGCMHICKEYISQLKELGVYDSATIILTSDHGSWWWNDTQPVYMIKKAGEHHEELAYNSAPISHDDFQATILSVLGQDHSEYGTSIWDWKAGDVRERVVYMRMDDENYPKVKGSSYNTYYGYHYSTNKEELTATTADGPDEIMPATPWIN